MQSHTIYIGFSDVLFQCQAMENCYCPKNLGYLMKDELKLRKFQKVEEQADPMGKV